MQVHMPDGPDGLCGVTTFRNRALISRVEQRQGLKRIAAQMHRRGTSVVLLTRRTQIDHIPDTDDVGHDTDLLICRLQAQGRPLFDMHFDEAGPNWDGIDEILVPRSCHGSDRADAKVVHRSRSVSVSDF